jgi:hypothetical protein
MLLLAFAFLQLVVSARPGLVDIVDGEVNARQYEQITAGKAIRTGANSHVEFSVGWEAFLRLEENSVAVLESADRTTVAVRIESGSAVIEVAGLNKNSRIVVTSGSLKTLIDSTGIFRFSANTASVLKGKLKTFDKSAEVTAGWEITNAGGAYQRTKLAMEIAQEFKRFMNGPKAGFVNAVVGEANVQLHEQARTGNPVQTGPDSHVELLLAPGSFLRLAENSAAVIESDSLINTIVRVISGTALLESDVVDAQLAIRVVVGPRKVLIVSGGSYRFTNETASVLDGSLQIELEKKGLGYRIGKGRQIRAGSDAYQEGDSSLSEPDELDRWSARRSYQLATANFMAQYGDAAPNFYLFHSRSPNDAAWIYSPLLNGFTFIPRRRYDSYYKHTFVPLYVFQPHSVMLPEFPTFPLPSTDSSRVPLTAPPAETQPSAPAPPPPPSEPPAPAPAPGPEPQ